MSRFLAWAWSEPLDAGLWVAIALALVAALLLLGDAVAGARRRLRRRKKDGV